MNKIQMIKQVYERTGVSLAAAKQAVEAVNMSSIEEAMEHIRTNGWEPKPRDTARPKVGVIKTYTHHNNSVGAMVELLCDTDFVANSDVFGQLAHNLLLQVVGGGASTVEDLLAQDYLLDETIKVSQLIQAVQNKVKEHIVVGRFVCWNIKGSD